MVNRFPSPGQLIHCDVEDTRKLFLMEKFPWHGKRHSSPSLLEFSESPVMPCCKNLSFSHMLMPTGPPQSITERLLFWEKDPVEILLNLGFGVEEPDVRTKIPPRFLSGVSVAKGYDIQAFLEAQKKQMDIERPNLYDSDSKDQTLRGNAAGTANH
ncbi:protein ITPRID1 [Serinus canaria]|uniref:protein ITPRID1 n=1 Tax=Serinus canaria TaxID=9135 RepID=UPI0021CCAB6F|nr:protein ITPRID1 [Serinus canaria]